MDYINSYLNHIQEQRKVDLAELKRRLTKFAKEQYSFCEKKTRALLDKHGVKGEYRDLQIKYNCHDAVASAIYRQRKICKEVGGILADDRMKCEDMVYEMMKKHENLHKKYKKQFKKIK